MCDASHEAVCYLHMMTKPLTNTPSVIWCNSEGGQQISLSTTFILTVVFNDCDSLKSAKYSDEQTASHLQSLCVMLESHSRWHCSNSMELVGDIRSMCLSLFCRCSSVEPLRHKPVLCFYGQRTDQAKPTKALTEQDNSKKPSFFFF